MGTATIYDMHFSMPRSGVGDREKVPDPIALAMRMSPTQFALAHAPVTLKPSIRI